MLVRFWVLITYERCQVERLGTPLSFKLLLFLAMATALLILLQFLMCYKGCAKQHMLVGEHAVHTS